MINFKLGTTLTDIELCKELGIIVPRIPKDRTAAIRVINNFQIKKSFAVAELNKSIADKGIQLSQKSHTNYQVVSTETKLARLKLQSQRLSNSINRLG